MLAWYWWKIWMYSFLFSSVGSNISQWFLMKPAWLLSKRGSTTISWRAMTMELKKRSSCVRGVEPRLR